MSASTVDTQTLEEHRRSVELPDGTTVGYLDRGEGPVAVFVHGIFLSSYTWRHVIDEVADMRRCIAVDLMAHGRTKAGPGQAFTMTSQAEMIVALLDELQIDRFDLVGGDTGGGVCQVIAANHPNRLRSLVLTNCDVHDNWPPGALDTIEAMAEAGAIAETAQALLADPDFARSESGLGIGYQHPDRLTDDAIVNYMAPLATEPGNAPLLEHFLLNPDVSELTSLQPALAALEVPTAVVWADADIFFGVEWGRWLLDTIPGCRTYVELAGAKLFFPEDRPHDLTPVLRHHWSGAAH